MKYRIIRLSGSDLQLMDELTDCFGREFDETVTYSENKPSKEYLHSLLSSQSFIALAAISGHKVIGGLVAYELKKFEQQRSEIYIYDLAICTKFRRKGIATSLIERTKSIAAECGAWVVFVQADYVDEPAVKLYTKLGKREDVLHFDIPLVKNGDST